MKHKITLRKEINDVGISITEVSTNKLIFKSSIDTNGEYEHLSEFNEISNMFCKYLDNSIVEFRDLERYYILFANLLQMHCLPSNPKIEKDIKLNIIRVDFSQCDRRS